MCYCITKFILLSKLKNTEWVMILIWLNSEMQTDSHIKNDVEKIRRINHTINWLEDGNENFVIRERGKSSNEVVTY